MPNRLLEQPTDDYNLQKEYNKKQKQQAQKVETLANDRGNMDRAIDIDVAQISVPEKKAPSKSQPKASKNPRMNLAEDEDEIMI